MVIRSGKKKGLAPGMLRTATEVEYERQTTNDERESKWIDASGVWDRIAQGA